MGVVKICGFCKFKNKICVFCKGGVTRQQKGKKIVSGVSCSSLVRGESKATLRY